MPRARCRSTSADVTSRARSDVSGHRHAARRRPDTPVQLEFEPAGRRSWQTVASTTRTAGTAASGSPRRCGSPVMSGWCRREWFDHGPTAAAADAGPERISGPRRSPWPLAPAVGAIAGWRSRMQFAAGCYPAWPAGGSACRRAVATAGAAGQCPDRRPAADSTCATRRRARPQQLRVRFAGDRAERLVGQLGRAASPSTGQTPGLVVQRRRHDGLRLPRLLRRGQQVAAVRHAGHVPLRRPHGHRDGRRPRSVRRRPRVGPEPEHRRRARLRRRRDRLVLRSRVARCTAVARCVPRHCGVRSARIVVDPLTSAVATWPRWERRPVRGSSRHGRVLRLGRAAPAARSCAGCR